MNMKPGKTYVAAVNSSYIRPLVGGQEQSAALDWTVENLGELAR